MALSTIDQKQNKKHADAGINPECTSEGCQLEWGREATVWVGSLECDVQREEERLKPAVHLQGPGVPCTSPSYNYTLFDSRILPATECGRERKLHNKLKKKNNLK